jgi:transcriptional regulator GlxA family with amidase domain
MKQVTILFPAGKAKLSSIMGSLEILSRANDYWKTLGNKPMMEINIAGFVGGPVAQREYFSVHPLNITKINKTDLVIIPSITHDYADIIENNPALISWIQEQYKNGADIETICAGAFLQASTGLLDGETSSMHWAGEQEFRQMFPNIDLRINKLITAEKGIYANGGAFSFLLQILQ